MQPELPEALRGASLPAVLLPYQRELAGLVERHPVVVCEKSRRIGMTWAMAASAVLTAAARRAAGGMDVLYIGYNLDMAREFIDTAAMWARAFALAAAEVEEFVWRDGEDRDIQAFRLHFASGYEVVALTSRPRSLRGRQGFVIVDEAAFHDDLPELLKAALALLMWGGRVLVISTHDGVDNPFAELVDDVRAGRKPYALQRVTLDDALRDGLYRRICLVLGRPWSAEAEAQWRDELIAFYGDAADEELFCIPRRSSGAWLPRALIEARMVLPAHAVVRWQAPAGFAQRPDAERAAAMAGWCDAELGRRLAALSSDEAHVFGLDFGRSGDLTVLCALAEGPDLVRRARLMVELRDCPFRQQEQVLEYVADRLPRLRGGALDARGNGQYLAERAAQRYGHLIEQVMLSERWYREHMPPLKAALEDATLLLPRDAALRDDLRAVRVVDGVPRLPKASTAGRGQARRHGDAAMALALAYAAARREVAPIEFAAAGRTRAAAQTAEDFGYEEALAWLGW